MTADAEFHVDKAGLARQVQPILWSRLASIQRRAANQARADVPVDTGNLGRTIAEDEITFVGPFRAEGGVSAGGPEAPYAAAVHDGSRPHLIRPRHASVLRFEIGNRVVFAREVHHPGTRARPFLRNAVERVISQET